MKQAPEELIGTYSAHRWAKEDGSWIIASLKDGITIVGAAKPDMFIPGVEYRFSGRWETHSTYGEQFRFQTFIAQEAVTKDAVMAYLRKYLFGSGHGVGEIKARMVIEHVGAEKTMETLKRNPKLVAEVTGITVENARKIADGLTEIEKFEATRMSLVQLFSGRGFSQECIERAIKTFGVCAADRIRRDPFTLLVRKYPSAGFLRCDQLYTDLGLNESRLKRQTICLWHQIQKASGSVWISAEHASIELRRLVSSNVNPKKAIRLGLRAKWLAMRRDRDGKVWLAEREDARNERLVAKYAEELKHGAVDEEPVGCGDYFEVI